MPETHSLGSAERALVPHHRESHGLRLVPDGDDCVAPRLRTFRYAPSSRLVLAARPGASTHHLLCGEVLGACGAARRFGPGREAREQALARARDLLVQELGARERAL